MKRIQIALGDLSVPAEQLHHYTIRFYQAASGPLPILYFEGKRLTKPWRIELSAEIAEDMTGGNANTA